MAKSAAWPIVAVVALGACITGSTSTLSRVTFSARDAWPKRGTEPPALTRDEMIRVAVVLDACALPLPDGAFHPWPYYLYRGDVSVDEERAMPMPSDDGHTSGLRWGFLLRSVLGYGGDCSQIAVRRTQIALDGTNCSETGCTGPRRPVRCDGSVATLGDAASGTTTRDCVESFQACDASSPTGCSDRPAMACDAHARDERCDGNVLLGCSETGFATFRDCSLQGGTCVETEAGAECRYSRPVNPCSIYDERCAAGKRTYCVAGELTEVDCAAMGFDPCIDGSMLSASPAASSRDFMHPCRLRSTP